MNVSCYDIEVKPNNSTKRLGVKFIIVNVYEQIFFESFSACAKGKARSKRYIVVGFTFFGKS